MTTRQLRTGGRLTLISSLLVTAGITISKSLGSVEYLELLHLDHLIHQRPQLPPDPRMTILGITEADCQRYRCPLSDALMAEALGRLQAHAPRVIGLDIYRTFPHPPGRPALEKRLQASNLIAITNVGEPSSGGIPAPEPVGPERVGFNDLPTDVDGVIRRNLLFVSGPDGGAYAFGLQVALAYLGRESHPVSASDDVLKIGRARFPALKIHDGGYHRVDNNGYQTLLRYRGPDAPAATLTLTQLLNQEFDPQLIRDRIVLIGTTAESSKDLFLTPYSFAQRQNFKMSGVEIHAQIISQILDVVEGESALYRFIPSWSEILWLWLWCLAASALTWSTRHPWQLAVLSGLSLMGLLATSTVAIAHLIWLPTIEPLLGFVVTLGVATTHRLLYRTTHDALTNLPNREVFLHRIKTALKQPRSSTQSKSVIVAFLGIDRFKVINESLGHRAGDQLLLLFVERLRQSLPAGTCIARVGGDEFAVLFSENESPGPTWMTDSNDYAANRSSTSQLLDQLQLQLSVPFELYGHKILHPASIGVAMTQPQYNHKAIDLLRDAHTAMYRAKSLKQSRYEVFATGMLGDAVSQLELESDLLKALENQEFILHYQPIVHLSTGEIAGFEALVRWQHPSRGFVSPGAFIPAAEETGLIVPLGQWIFQAACYQLSSWRRQFPDRHLTMSINLSGRQLSQPNLVQQLAATLAATPIPDGCIRLEITESMMMGDIDATIELMLQLKSLNFKLAIDDFGTGYSSLSYLHRFPMDTLKVDKSFVGRAELSSEDRAIVQTILTLGQQLGMEIVAEGIENAAQVQLLLQETCSYGQGFFFSKPLSAAAATELLAWAYTLPVRSAESPLRTNLN